LQECQEDNAGCGGCADEGDVGAEEAQQRPGDVVGAALDLVAATPRPELRRIADREVGYTLNLTVHHSGERVEVAVGSRGEEGLGELV
jgi:hypothetical protein